MSVVSQYLAASGFPVAVVVAWVAAVGVSAGLGRTLVIRFGAMGAAATLSVTYGALLTALILLCWRTARADRASRA
jgi:O-antigen/teichoic acid export membrane protein